MALLTSPIQQASQFLNKSLVRGLSAVFVNEKVPVAIARQRFNRLNLMAAKPRGVEVRQSHIAGVPVDIITPHDLQSSHRLLYFHGGAFCVGSPQTHRDLTVWLAKALGWQVVVPDYRLAPEHKYPAAPDDCLSVYQAMVDDPAVEHVVIGGDSAGGNLALVTLLRLKAQGGKMPPAAVLYSPWTDLRCCTESFYTKRDLDPMLTRPWLHRMREHYCAGEDLHHWELSPLFGDLAGLPPILLHAGGNEILLNDAINLEMQLKQQQSPVHCKIWHELWHVFHAHVQYLAIARQAIYETRDFIQQSLAMDARRA